MAEEKILNFARFQASAFLSVLGPTGCPETSASNYHYKLRNNPEELISCTWFWPNLDIHGPIGSNYFKIEAVAYGRVWLNVVLLFYQDCNEPAFTSFISPSLFTVLFTYIRSRSWNNCPLPPYSNCCPGFPLNQVLVTWRVPAGLDWQTVHVWREVIKVYGLRIFGLHLDARHGLLGLSLFAISLQHTVQLVNREIIFLIHDTFFLFFICVFYGNLSK